MTQKEKETEKMGNLVTDDVLNRVIETNEKVYERMRRLEEINDRLFVLCLQQSQYIRDLEAIQKVKRLQ